MDYGGKRKRKIFIVSKEKDPNHQETDRGHSHMQLVKTSILLDPNSYRHLEVGWGTVLKGNIKQVEH